MIGKHRDGGYAEFIVMPARSVFKLPAEISFEHGAVMMCSSATSLHALKKARLRPGETVAVYGAGGLGASAVQLARALGAGEVFAVDIQIEKLDLARKFGAVPVNAKEADPVKRILELTGGRGVDVALELVGLPVTMRQSVLCLAIHGRAALVGITDKSFEVSPYRELLGKEAEIIGVSDHLANEMPALIEFARQGKLDLSEVVTRTVPLAERAINETLDRLEQFREAARVVIVP
jgi:propanol-preferring alcohol dehydrogenase